jgi:hypothetical protein
MPDRLTNVLDVETAIELFTPLYALFLTDGDFWRASNSLQLDETIGLYVATILGTPEHLLLVNNKHPLVPESTLRAGHRLVLHGLSSEMLHTILRAKKTEAASSDGLRVPDEATVRLRLEASPDRARRGSAGKAPLRQIVERDPVEVAAPRALPPALELGAQRGEVEPPMARAVGGEALQGPADHAEGARAVAPAEVIEGDRDLDEALQEVARRPAQAVPHLLERVVALEEVAGVELGDALVEGRPLLPGEGDLVLGGPAAHLSPW